MGSDMANIKAGKSSNSNLKVPPLKIVLSSHQNNSAIVNTNSNDNEQTELHDKDYKVETDEEACSKQPSRKNSRSERKASDSGHAVSKTATNSSSYSSSSNSSDRSTSTSPSSESESLDSNLTIISENNQVKAKADQKEETPLVKQERSSKHSGKSATSNPSTGAGKRNLDNGSSAETSGELAASSSREPTSGTNQRITRSSQRAAQQNRAENPSETNGDDSVVVESQDKTVESSRKVKRRKGEPQESELESSQTAQQTITMANICPADYQPPSQNSFELYRDIRERPYKKMLQLNHIQPRMPYGFKDYLINGGPYLLDGNRLGSGLNGAIENNTVMHNVYTPVNRNNTPASRLQLRMKLSNLHRKLSSTQASQQRHSAYVIPKHLDPPKSLRVGSPLYDLFQDQEKSRHQMRMQHLKERERSVLTTEQEILRVYNRMAIADNRQEFHLSACTYFYYQERYHYLDETIDPKKEVIKEVSLDQDKAKDGTDQAKVPSNVSDSNEVRQDESKEGTAKEIAEKKHKNQHSSESLTEGKKIGEEQIGEDTGITDTKSDQIVSDTPKPYSSDNSQETKSRVAPEDQDSVKKSGPEMEATVEKTEYSPLEHNKIDGPSPEDTKSPPNKEEGIVASLMSDDELKTLNKSVFLDQLHIIDDKWAKIMEEMFIRHKNESDSLYAVQSLEWEWKAKEIGACDVRVTPYIEPDCVPRVEVSELDY